MAYDKQLANHIAALIEDKQGITKRKMFGGICFMLHGNMVCGVIGEKLCVRIGAHAYENALSKKHTQPMDFTGKPIKSMVFVLPEAFETEEALSEWIDQSLLFVQTLPKKQG